MKKQLLIVSMLLMVAILAASASALQITQTSITFGSTSKDRIDDVTAQITVKNDGTATINSITFSDTIDDKYNVRYPTVSQLAPNASVTLTVTADIPLDYNAVETDENSADYLNEKAFKIGVITATAGGTSDTVDANMQAVNQLEIKKASLECGDKSKNLKDGTEFTELKPDTSCSLYIEIENNFNDKDTNSLKIGDINFEDAEVQIEVDDSDFDVDDDDSVDPDPDDYDDTTFEFEIDEEVADGTYDLIIRAIGQDENGAWHGDVWEINLKVDRLKHDLQIKNAVMTPEKMDCKGGKLKVDAKIINLGSRDEDDVVVELEIPDLDLEAKKTGIQLDENDYASVSFTLDIPKDVKEGVYVVNLGTYFDSIAPSNTKTFNLAVEACPAEPAADTTTTTTVTTTPTQPTTPAAPATPAQPAAPSARVRTSDDAGFTGSNTYLGLLGVLIAVIVVIIIVLVVVMLRRPKK